MSLVLEIATTHVRARARQSLVAVLGVATGVGFAIMMSALMQGSQVDFVQALVNALPHITLSDDRPAPTVQPAERLYASAEIHGLIPHRRRKGIKNPLATMAALEGWMPGAIAPAVNTQVIMSYSGRDVSATVVGVDPAREPQVSNLAVKMRQGTIRSLYRATNGVLLGSRLARKIGARVGSNVSLTPPNNVRMNAEVVGIFHLGVRTADEGTIYTLAKTAQILADQIGLVNEMRFKLADPMIARDVAGRITAETGYLAVSWDEAHEELLSAFRLRENITVLMIGAILLVASFGTYNIVSTITHEKARDIAIMKSLGLRERTVRRIFVLEALMIGAAGAALGSLLGFALCLFLGSLEFEFSAFTDMTRMPILYSPAHYVTATAVALVSSGVAGFLPARKAARQHPVAIIRGAT
ncbi:ABC transporter permease [Rhodoplanes sp. TEM]|uniref:ABC transporter permease n=1 Tax=Rhodoplanes tepidamans TaxID=200616 RepID=A0ABT5JET1_RHOTP|nr:MULTISPECIES: ABC transporter permease [Rhodoplanes]MDC7788200.1 ABC transporter permease [Rhodoplanes tepidamans]MDC7983542.1 ABC transporter permease [Rhodoplanes sp. TEM]MDQ0354216.1 lipoprotein-releasing system permease protein [Rhodoplanes tepidamans]